MLRLLLVAGLGVVLSGQVTQPNAGFSRFPDGTVRPVYGLPESLIVGGPMLGSATAASFSEGGGVVATTGQVELLRPDGSSATKYPCTEAHPVVNIDDMPNTAIVWLPSTQTILHVEGGTFVPTTLSIPLAANVTDIQRNGHTAQILGVDGRAVLEWTISLDSGDLISERVLPGITGSAFRFGRFLIYNSREGLQIQNPNGSAISTGINSADCTIERMSKDSVHAACASGTQWVLRIQGESVQRSELPGVPAGGAK